MTETHQNPKGGADASDPMGELSQISMIELAKRLDGITAAIEAQRARERQARQAYLKVREEVEAQIERIRSDAALLVREHDRRIRSFDGMIGGRDKGLGDPIAELKPGTDIDVPNARPRTIEEAILRIWSLERYCEPLTTEQIALALPEVGYESKAAARSLRSTVNQALAKLSRDGRIRKYRMDGTPLPEDQPDARARRYRPV